MGGRFGEMSTLMNHTTQSFDFRGRQKARRFYDLVANIAAEEYGHIELVAATTGGRGRSLPPCSRDGSVSATAPRASTGRC
jgi:Mn-containing catalase